jgi:hypothetical protein
LAYREGRRNNGVKIDVRREKKKITKWVIEVSLELQIVHVPPLNKSLIEINPKTLKKAIIKA